MIAPPGSLAIKERLPVVLSFRDGSGRRSLRYQPASKSSGPLLRPGDRRQNSRPSRLPYAPGCRNSSTRRCHSHAVRRARGRKSQVVNSDPMHRGPAPNEGDASKTKQNASAPPVLIFDRIGISAYFSSLTRCSACFRCSLKSLRPVSSRLLSSPFCAAGISVDSSAPMTAS